MNFRYLLLGLTVLFFSSAQAIDTNLTPFDAEYHLFKNKNEIGTATLKVDVEDNQLRWQTTLIPEGIIALVTDKRPHTVSVLSRASGGYQLESVKISTHPTDDPIETAEFDWKQSSMTASRKNTHVNLPLTGDVYDYLSIHWLAAQMSLIDSNDHKLNFYNNGKIVRSTLTRKGIEPLKIGKKTIETVVFELRFEGANKRFTYHYSLQNRWLPLRIERLKKGKKTIMVLKSQKTTG